ncbi:MAG: glycosyltransferase family 4 protein [Bacteroidales bacterium]|nr:glycosyltransferase family 4 protein [Bacteroidales bacterium]
MTPAKAIKIREDLDGLPQPPGRPDPHLDRVVVINDEWVARGGATSIALTSVKLLHERGVPTTFIAGNSGVDSDHSVQADDFVSLGGTHILQQSALAGAISGLYNATSQLRLSRWIAANDTPRTVYHLHGWSKILSPAVFHALRPVARRLVLTAHDFFLVCPNGGYYNYKSEIACKLKPMGAACLLAACDRRSQAQKMWRLMRQMVQQAVCDLDDVAIVLAVHDGMIPDLILGGVPKSRLRALRNPVVPWRTTRVEAESNDLFLYVGRVEREKGVDLLAAAARKAGVRLGIVGRGSLQPRLAAAYPDMLQLGWKTHAELAELIGGARALVMPSRYPEPFGLVAVEALTSGLPVVISSTAMLADEIVMANYGIACDPSDVSALAAALSRFAHDDALIAAMSRNAHAGAGRLACSPSEWVDDLITIYRSVLDAPACRPELER